MIRWALGVLIYFMLQSDMPFGSWRESELEPITKIAKGHLVMPVSFSAEVVDLVTKVISCLKIVIHLSIYFQLIRTFYSSSTYFHLYYVNSYLW